MRSPIRVLMFCSQFRPIVGGAEGQAELLARTLLSQGCEVAVLTPHKVPSSPQWEDADGLVIHRFAVTDLVAQYPAVRGLGVANLTIERRQVRRAVRRLLPAFDILHTHIASPLVLFAQEEAQVLGKPMLCKIACGGRGFDFNAIRGGSILGGRFERRLVRRVQRWIAISEEVREDLLRAGVPESRITGIPNGIRVTGPPLARGSGGARRFLVLGRLMKFDMEAVLVAFRDLLKDVPDSELRIVGRGDTDALRTRVESVPELVGRVEVVGFAPSDPEYARADALIHPSRAEGLSNALLEAMAAGLPCAASDIPPNRELLDGGGSGLLFPLGGGDGIRSALLRLAREAELGSRLAAAARHRIETRFEIGVVAERYRELYEQMLAGQGEPGEESILR